MFVMALIYPKISPARRGGAAGRGGTYRGYQGRCHTGEGYNADASGNDHAEGQHDMGGNAGGW